MIGFEKGNNSLDDVLGETEIPKNFDFASIDVDGVDYYIWESLVEYRPRVVAIEFNHRVPNDIIFVQDRDMSINQGCSASALIELGKTKGYELISIVGCNCFFVVKDEYWKFGIQDNSISAMRRDVIGRIFCGYDGAVYQTLQHLGWNHKKVEVAPDAFQPLSEKQRVFGGEVSDK